MVHTPTVVRSCSPISLALGALCLTAGLSEVAPGQVNEPGALGTPTAGAAGQGEKFKPKKILKQEVDALIRAVRGTQRKDGTFGDGSTIQTAKFLTAAANSHRFYAASEGPWVRNGINALFKARQGNGGYGGVEATRWVIGALSGLEPQMYRQDIDAALEWLDSRGEAASSPWEIRRNEWRAPIEGGADAVVAFAQKTGGGAMKLAQTDPIEALVTLTICQSMARGEAEPMHYGKTPAVPDARPWLPMQEKAFQALFGMQKDGVFSITVAPGKSFPDPGLTALGLAALQTKPVDQRAEAESKAIGQGLDWLLSLQGERGEFGQRSVNYTTCAAVQALARAQKAAPQERIGKALAKAQKYLVALQNAEDRGYSASDRDYGSIGYGGDERGDLSNLQFALEALTLTELDENSELYEKAKVFLQRTQNLRKVNDFKARVRHPETGEWQTVESGDDGGAAYYPGNSPAGYITLPDGTQLPRSYGSMTYALLKAYILCGLKPDDPRIQAAVQWMENNWTLQVNPGSDPKLGEKVQYQGLYYYYMVLAQALDTAGIDTLRIQVEDKDFSPAKTGKTTKSIDWRSEVVKHLAKLQGENGTWRNEKNGRWYESLDLLCTTYAMLALERAVR